jgi:hypothetical protein
MGRVSSLEDIFKDTLEDTPRGHPGENLVQ